MFTTHQWTDEYKIGIPDIDQDHEKLFVSFNEFIITAKNGGSIEELSTIFSTLLSHVDEHFKNEEKIMEDMNYVNFMSHCEIHKQLYKDAKEVAADFKKSNEPVDILPYACCLQGLIVDHILIHDLQIQQAILTNRDEN